MNRNLRIILTLLFALTMPFASSAQKAFKDMKASMKAKKYADVLKQVEKAEADSTLRADFRLFDFSIQANIGLNEAENTKNYLKQPYDTVRLFSTALQIVRLSLRADSLAQVYESRVRAGEKPKGAKPLPLNTLKGYVRTYYSSILAACRWHTSRNRAKESMPYLRTALDVPEDARLGGAIQGEHTDSLQQRLMWNYTRAAYRTQQWSEVHRYERRLLALTASRFREGTADATLRATRCALLELLALTYQKENDEAHYGALLRQGRREYPERAFFLQRLFLLYNKEQRIDDVLALADEELKRDSLSTLALSARATALHQLGRNEEAARTALYALYTDSTLAEMHYYIGEEFTLRAMNVPLPTGNIRSKAYKAAKKQKQDLFLAALPHLEAYRAAAPEAYAVWAPLLYEDYLELNRAEAFLEIENLMKQHGLARIKSVPAKPNTNLPMPTESRTPSVAPAPVATPTGNPLLSDFPTLFHSYPFSAITVAEIEAAVLEGIRRNEAEIEAIVANPEKPTFENTILALETGDQTLSRAETLLENLLSAHSNDSLVALSEKLTPVLTDHAARVAFNEPLFQRVKAVWEQREAFTGEELRLIENCYEGFERAGATLPKELQEKFKLNQEKFSLLALQFSQNTIKARAAYVMHIIEAEELEGLTPLAMETAAEEAKRRGLEGWCFTLAAPSYVPFMTYCANRARREELYTAYNTLCTDGEYNNLDIVRELVNLRMERAQMLGYSSHADYVLGRRMAEKKENVYNLLQQLITSYRPAALRDVADVEERARQAEGDDFQLRPWDFSYYANLLRRERYDLDAELFRPYLKLENVKRGVFELATQLYGITFHPRTDIETYHPEVEIYEVRNEAREHLGLIYMDFFPRDEKKSGAWMTSFRSQWHDSDGTDHRPHVSVVFNFTKPTAEKPALLTLGEVSTFLHEFGHALHGLFSNVRYESLCSPNVYWDFVELPSQFMENYATEPAFLHTFARHYLTDEPLPDDYIERLKKSRTFNAAYACMRQVQYGLLDMAYYTRTEPLAEPIIPFERRAWAEAALLADSLEQTCMSTQFGHIMAGGYSAGYYSYKWAEVLDADAFALFQERGIFNKETARSFRENILERGASEHPMTLYLRFRGQKPTIDALLRRDGIQQ